MGALTQIRLPEFLSAKTLGPLRKSILDAAEDHRVRAVLIRGAEGSKVFCRGMDFSALLDSNPSDAELKGYTDSLLALRRMPKPVIAVVEGEALAGGLGFVAASDLVVATPDARFGLSEALFGLVPAMVFPFLLERIPPQKARLLALSPQGLTVSDAKIWGLVDEIVGAHGLEDHLRVAEKAYFRLQPESVAWIKKAGESPLLEAAVEQARSKTLSLSLDPALRERLRAFIEDGTPPWRDL